MNRKTIYLGLLLFAAILWGCSEEPVEEPTPPQVEALPVNFLVEGEWTKGVVTTHEDAIHSLGIIGYSTGEYNFDEMITPELEGTLTPNLFNNVHAQRMEVEEGVLSAWHYAPAVYWPSNTDIKNTFFAYSPYQEQRESEEEDEEGEEEEAGPLYLVTDQGSPQIIYRVPSEVSEQIDLLYSDYTAVGATNLYHSSNDGQVKFHMKHALLWLRFIIAPVAISSKEAESYQIREFNLTAGSIINTGRFDMRTATWKAIPDLPDSDEGFESVDYNFDSFWAEDGSGYLDVNAKETLPVGGKSSTNCLMIIPQSIEHKKNQTTVSVLFTYNDGTEESGSNDEYYVTMPFPDVKLDKAGYVMTFVVKISAKGSWVEFQDSNKIETWLEDTEEREIETY